MSYLQKEHADRSFMVKMMADLMALHKEFLVKHGELKSFISDLYKTKTKGEPGKSIIGPQGPQGEPGRTYTAQELLMLLQPVLPVPQAGKDAVITQRHIDMAATLVAKKIKIPKLNPEIDPMKIIDIVLNMPEGKRLTTKHIDGLEQTIEAIKNQTKHGYLHGGGDTVKAGTNITIVQNSDGTKTITSSGGGFTPMTTIQRLALSATNGTTAYDTDIGAPYIYVGGAWYVLQLAS